MTPRTFLLVGLVGVAFAPPAFTDSESANFKIEGDSFSGSESPSLSSAGFKVEEPQIDWFTKETQESTNYQIEGKIGSATTPPVPPVIDSIAPPERSRFHIEESASYTIEAHSPEGSTLQYLAREGTVVKAGPQSSKALTWPLGVSDKGRHLVNFEVIDPDATASQSQSFYAYRKPKK